MKDFPEEHEAGKIFIARVHTTTELRRGGGGGKKTNL